MTERDHSATLQSAWRRYLLGSTLFSATWLLPVGAALGADYLPGKVPAQVGADSSILCKYWTGLGTEEYFFVADDEGYPLPVSAWLRWADPKELAELFDTLYGFAWINSRPGLNWLGSPAGSDWLNSAEGKAWKEGIMQVQSTPTPSAGPEPVEYVKICSLYGAGYYYIPGTETCLKVGGYIRSQIAANGEPTEYGQLRSYVNNQFMQIAGFTFGKSNSYFNFEGDWSPTLRVSRSFGGDEPQTTKGRDQPAFDSRIRISRSFGDGPSPSSSGDDSLKNFAEILSGKGISGAQNEPTTKAPEPIIQTKGPAKGGPKGPAQTANQQKGPPTKGGKGPDAQPVEQGIKIHFKVNQAMLDKSEVGPALGGQHVQLFPAGEEPDLPTNETRRAELENNGHNQDAPRCVTNADGKCTTRVPEGAEEEFGFPQLKVGLRLNLDYKTEKLTQADYDFQKEWRLGANYTGTLRLRTYDSWVAETNQQHSKPDFSQLNIDGVSFRSNTFNVGPMEWVQVDASSVGGIGKTAEDIKQMLPTFLDKINQLGVKYSFEGNICRLELPGPWIEDVKSATRRGGGIPTAAISLRADRRGGSR
jgi:hypothetical protein